MNSESDFVDHETPLDDLSGLKDKTIRTRQELHAAEARNILRPTEKYLSSPPSRRVAPFTELWMRNLHREMFCHVWEWAGELRLIEITPVGAAPEQVAINLLELEKDIEYWRTFGGMSVVEQAARIHHRAVLIHPFLNGNGRWARMLANILLRQRKWGFVDWPEQHIAKSSTIRNEYIDALKQADDGSPAALIALHEKYRSERLA